MSYAQYCSERPLTPQKKAYTFPWVAYPYSTIFLCHSVNTVLMRKKKKKWYFQQTRNSSNQSLLCHLAILTTNRLFWRTWPVTQQGEMLSWWANVCWVAASQYGQDGSLLEIHVEKISCPSKAASVMALQCWRRKVLSLGKVSWLLSSPRGKAGEAQACCVHLCAYAPHASTSLHRARNVSLPFTLPTVAPAGSLLFTSPGTCCFSF